ncbi:MAG: RDD family protein [Candidatus Obscuribacterales bacterium]|jgi:uncharacterized RDD family membrane protein YckC
MHKDVQRHMQKRLYAAMIDASIVALTNAAIFSLLCYQILVEQGARQYSLTAMPDMVVISVNAISICAIWLGYCLTDALAVFPCMLALFIAFEMREISPLVGNFEYAFAAAISTNFLYHLIFEGSALRATPGKLLCGMTVNTREGKPAHIALTLRHLAKVIAAPAVLAAIAITWPLNLIERLGLKVPIAVLNAVDKIASGDDCRWPHDLISGTTVGQVEVRTAEVPSVT